MSENIYNMKLHDSVDLQQGGWDYEVIRVPGGWIYCWGHKAVFVPFDNEFQRVGK